MRPKNITAAYKMVDTVSPQRRAEIMSHIRSRDTKPELEVRCYLHRAGLRFRLHKKDLPGKPDLVFPSRRICLFVQGCFWHGCPNCIDGTRKVKSNSAYWTDKVKKNQERDKRHSADLEANGWRVLTIWECELRQRGRLAKLLGSILLSPIYRVS
jgi:DNA mismatch endonuclease (patch repair protein)